MIPKKSPGLLVRSIDSNQFYAVNCFYPNSLRILNSRQYDVLTAVDGKTDVSRLAERFGLDGLALREYFTQLSRTEIVRFDDRFRQPGRPDSTDALNIWIHTTNKCNLSCGYCYISTLQSTGGMSEPVRSQLLRKLVETVAAKDIKSIKLRFAGGEPLLQFKKWAEFVREAKTRLHGLGCELEISFLTNLTVLNDEIVSFAQEHNVGFGVSLDGIAQYQNQTRSFHSGNGTFARVEQNLKTLIDNDIRVSVNTVVANENLEGLPELTRYLIDLDIPFRYSIVKGTPVDPDLLELELLESYKIAEMAIDNGWRFSQKHQFCDLKPAELGFQTCASGFSGGAIYVDGSMHYCHVQFGDDTQQSFSIFDQEMDLVDMIEQGEHIETNRSSDCKICKYRSVCTSGCPVYRVNGKDPQCSIYHKFIPRIYDLLAKERLKLLRDYQIM
ncbi:radical SAM protein [Dyadobacter sp. CY261]|uniref:radical SAM/SPASM domain-containing protein n=1 Tax=Dyadobacter sp. CY261 TaxID=2907203 RepID=UPI001F26ED2B|nr:radical SAM protein [Dyadobacter sp. CY261]MCF0075229.1 radical SAM protein [Dyadobacter sp. CY261]